METRQIKFSIPVSLRESYDAFIESDTGFESSAILNNVVEEEVDGYIKGYVEVEWETFNPAEFESIKSDLNMLSSGFDIYACI